MIFLIYYEIPNVQSGSQMFEAEDDFSARLAFTATLKSNQQFAHLNHQVTNGFITAVFAHKGADDDRDPLSIEHHS